MFLSDPVTGLFGKRTFQFTILLVCVLQTLLLVLRGKPGFLLSPIFSLVLLYQQDQQVLGSDKI